MSLLSLQQRVVNEGMAKATAQGLIPSSARVPQSSTVARSPSPAPAPDPSGPQFDDPAIHRVEQHAIDNYGALTHPDTASPTHQYEQYLQQLATTLRAPAYSQGDEQVYTGGALDGIQREQTAAEQRWADEMGRRGIQPSSGIYLDGLQKLRGHYETLRTSTRNDFAKKAIDDTRTQRLQAADVLGRGVDAERQRQQLAGQYAGIPYQLEQDAFARNTSVANGGGSPASYFNSAVTLAQNQNTAQRQQTQDRSQAMQALFEYLASQGLL